METERFLESKMGKIFDRIDKLQLTSNYYYIDILPVKLLGDRYISLEEYLIQNYLKDFSTKICKIIIKLISYYDAEIYLTEFPNSTDIHQYAELYGKDIRLLSLQEINDIITYIIQKHISSVQVYFKDFPFLISINGAFSVDIYAANKEQVNLISQLVTQESLYLKSTE